MKVDHILICVDTPAQKVKTLTEFGLTEGEPNAHAGQGTANHRFFFDNIYFQFLYVANAELLQSETSKPSRLYERFGRKDNQISPFGICLYPAENQLKIEDYDSWEYRPKFVHSPLKMDVLETPIIEPMYYYMDNISGESKQTHKKYKHDIDFGEISKITIGMPDSSSKIRHDLNRQKIVEFVYSEQHLMTIEFDQGAQNSAHDFRPDLPLVFRW